MAEVVAELAEMRLSNGVSRVACVAGKLATAVENNVPLGDSIVGGAQAVLLALEAGVFVMEQAANRVL
jgi:hypothetical protein